MQRGNQHQGDDEGGGAEVYLFPVAHKEAGTPQHETDQEQADHVPDPSALDHEQPFTQLSEHDVALHDLGERSIGVDGERLAHQ